MKINTHFPNSVQGRFEAICAAFPHAPALVDNHGTISYEKLNERVILFSEELTKLGLSEEGYLPLLARRCTAYLVAILASCKLNIPYVAIDPTSPPERISEILRQLDCANLLIIGLDPELYDNPGVGRLHIDEEGKLTPLGLSVRRSADRPSMTAPPFTIMFTSGTTGVPKGVRIGHRGLLNLVNNIQRQVPEGGGRYLHHSSIAFDAALFEIWVPLLTGGQLAFHAPPFNIDSLDRRIHDTRCDVLLLTTSLFHLVAEHKPSLLKNIAVLYVGGEILSPVHARCVLELYPEMMLINGYGPTENTVFSTCHVLHDANNIAMDEIPIGVPLDNVNISVVDEHLRPLPNEKMGELLVGGENLSLGYINEQESKTRFVEISGIDYYKTGDYVVRDSEGVLHYKGRVDEQVKVQGYRIEITEVERALMELPGVGQAVVLEKNINQIESTLWAYIVFREGWNVKEDALLRQLSKRLPPYMVPSRLQCLSSLPVTSNGKVDKSFLRSLEPRNDEAEDLKGSPTRSAVLNLWSELLGGRAVEPAGSIYEYGASSLTVVMAYNTLNQSLDVVSDFEDVVRLLTIGDWIEYYDNCVKDIKKKGA